MYRRRYTKKIMITKHEFIISSDTSLQSLKQEFYEFYIKISTYSTKESFELCTIITEKIFLSTYAARLVRP